MQSPNRSTWTNRRGFQYLKRFLLADLNPFWCINCQHHFLVTDIECGHGDFVVDDEGFVLGLDKNLHDLGSPGVRRT